MTSAVLDTPRTAESGRPRRHRHTPLAPAYVYFLSGAVLEVPSISALTLTNESVQLRRDGGIAEEYPRSSVYFVSRDRICPPVPI